MELRYATIEELNNAIENYNSFIEQANAIAKMYGLGSTNGMVYSSNAAKYQSAIVDIEKELETRK